MQLVPKLSSVPVRPAPHFCAVRALEVSLGHHFQRLDIEHLIGDDLLEPAILVFQLFKAAQIADFKATIFRSPVVQRGAGNAVLAAQRSALTPALSSRRMPTICD